MLSSTEPWWRVPDSLVGQRQGHSFRGTHLIQSVKLGLAVLFLGASVQAQHDMARMRPGDLLETTQRRRASGTSWLPDSAAQRMWMTHAGGWDVMLHGSAFGMLDRQWTLHGDSRWGILDWEMARASRRLGGGVLRFSAMTSLESFFLPDTGYPQLLQTGESFGGRRIANTQHPHDLVGELAAGYEYPLNSKLVIEAYGGLVGEPALGPVAYRHRPSAASDPFAPLGAHWQDASHQSHGVATVGLASSLIQVEASAFNGRDADANRHDVQLTGISLDSYSARVTVAPGGRVVASAWGGYLADHDPLDPGVAMQRYGVSALTEAAPFGRRLSSALVWGLNNHHHGARGHNHEAGAPPMTHHLSSSILLESTLEVTDRTSIFGRVEQVQKMADDLGFQGGDLMETFNVRALSVGATRELASVRGMTAGVGGRIAVNFLPSTLRYTYTTTRPAGFALYLRILPSRDRTM